MSTNKPFHGNFTVTLRDLVESATYESGGFRKSTVEIGPSHLWVALGGFAAYAFGKASQNSTFVWTDSQQ